MAEADNEVANAEVARFLSAWFAVRQFIQAANFNHFHKAGLSATQFMILNLLPVSKERITIGELAKRMNLKPATIAKTVDSLEARALLKRERSADDGRVVLVQVTGRGQMLQNAAVTQFRRHIGKAFQGMRAIDRRALIEGLESFVGALGKATPARSAPTPDASGELPGTRNSRQSQRR